MLSWHSNSIWFVDVLNFNLIQNKYEMNLWKLKFLARCILQAVSKESISTLFAYTTLSKPTRHIMLLFLLHSTSTKKYAILALKTRVVSLGIATMHYVLHRVWKKCKSVLWSKLEKFSFSFLSWLHQVGCFQIIEKITIFFLNLLLGSANLVTELIALIFQVGTQLRFLV